jgi:CubicO group peptidase (beta-lactamase class C family)
MARGSLGLRGALIIGMVVAAAGSVIARVSAASELDAFIIERAAHLELPGPVEAPPTDTLILDAGGYARILCSAVFITGLEPAFAAEHVGYFTAPYASRAKLGQPVIDRVAKTVTVTLPDGRQRLAQHLGSQGCLTYLPGETTPRFRPEVVRPALPDAASQPWPMGDRLPAGPLPPGIDAKRLAAAVDAAFASAEGETAAFVVTWKGRIIAERYAPGITAQTPLESWSMGKSVTATLIGVLIQSGAYDLWQRAPIPEWQQPGDARHDIRIADLLRMSSGLRARAPFDPGYDPALGYPEHLYLYTGAFDAFHYAASRPLQYPVNTVGRYRNTDPVLANYLIKLAVERRHGDYLAFPQRALFDRLGIRSMVIETDAYGNLLTQGYDLGCARDWARLGNLYLGDGVWQGRRLLPRGFVDFVRSPAPAWLADGQNVYGGFFWLNGDAAHPVPKDAYYMEGVGGQFTFIIPSHELVVVRLGHYRGDEAGKRDLDRSLAILMQAVPPVGRRATDGG